MRQSLHKISAKIQRKFGKPFPTSLQLEVTNVCNFRCIMCPFHRPGSEITRATGFMTLDQIHKILTEFVDLGGGFLIPQGAGESFLHPEFIDILTMAKKQFGLRVGLNTNGVRLKREQMEAVIDLEVDELGFSVDALHPETFETITGSEELDGIEQNIQTLLELRQRNNKRSPLIRTLIVEQETNAGEIDEYVRKWTSIVDEVVVQVERIKSGRCLRSTRSERRQPCRHLFDTVFIQWDGDVVVCCEDWQSQTIMGNVQEKPLKEIWFGNQMNLYREMQKNGTFAPPSICENCEAWAGGKKSNKSWDHLDLEETELTRTFKRKKDSNDRTG